MASSMLMASANAEAEQNRDSASSPSDVELELEPRLDESPQLAPSLLHTQSAPPNDDGELVPWSPTPHPLAFLGQRSKRAPPPGGRTPPPNPNWWVS